MAVKSQIHAAHGEQCALGNGHHGIHVTGVALLGLDHLGRCVVVRDVEPQAVGDGGGLALAPGEGIAAHEIGALGVGIVQGVEEIGGGGGQQVADVLLQCVDVFAGRVLGDEAVVVDGVDVAFLGDHVAEAAAGGVLEGDAPGLVAQDALDVVAVVQLVVESGGNAHRAGGVTVLDHDDVVRLKEGAPGGKRGSKVRRVRKLLAEWRCWYRYIGVFHGWSLQGDFSPLLQEVKTADCRAEVGRKDKGK